MISPKNKAVDYPFIRARGLMMASEPTYITAQVKKARESNAPHTACYFAEERRPPCWVLLETCAEITQLHIKRIAERWTS
jgi:hypothetical protein